MIDLIENQKQKTTEVKTIQRFKNTRRPSGNITTEMEPDVDDRRRELREKIEDLERAAQPKLKLGISPRLISMESSAQKMSNLSSSNSHINKIQRPTIIQGKPKGSR